MQRGTSFAATVALLVAFILPSDFFHTHESCAAESQGSCCVVVDHADPHESADDGLCAACVIATQYNAVATAAPSIATPAVTSDDASPRQAVPSRFAIAQLVPRGPPLFTQTC